MCAKLALQGNAAWQMISTSVMHVQPKEVPAKSKFDVESERGPSKLTEIEMVAARWSSCGTFGSFRRPGICLLHDYYPH